MRRLEGGVGRDLCGEVEFRLVDLGHRVLQSELEELMMALEICLQQVLHSHVLPDDPNRIVHRARERDLDTKLAGVGERHLQGHHHGYIATHVDDADVGRSDHLIGITAEPRIVKNVLTVHLVHQDLVRKGRRNVFPAPAE